MTHTIWIDVEDLFEYAVVNSRPTGIQRLSFQLYLALQERDNEAETVRFVRHLPCSAGLRCIEWRKVAMLFEELTHASQPAADTLAAWMPGEVRRTWLRAGLQALPPALRVAVADVLVAARRTFRALVNLVGICRKEWSRNPRSWRSGTKHLTAETFAALAAQGDVLLSLGSPWANTRYPGLIGPLRDTGGVRFGTLVYDLIPLRRHEWCQAELAAAFCGWYEAMLPLCDHVFAMSQATASDVSEYARERRVGLPRPVVMLPLGTEPGVPRMTGKPGRDLPRAGSYALIVATIEARKNHLLLFRVWRRLLDELPHEEVPTLVFAGRVGWLVEDLMRQIANTGNLGGKLVLINGPTDPELEALYRGCHPVPVLHRGAGPADHREPRIRQALHHLEPQLASRGGRRTCPHVRPGRPQRRLRRDRRHDHGPRGAGKVGGQGEERVPGGSLVRHADALLASLAAPALAA